MHAVSANALDSFTAPPVSTVEAANVHAASRLSDESFVSGVKTGFENRVHQAEKNPLSTALEVAGSFTIGVALAYSTKNPEAAFGLAGGFARVAPKAFGLMALTDLSRRLDVSSWGSLGNNLGSALFDYPLSFAAGGLGAGAEIGLASFKSDPLSLGQINLSSAADSIKSLLPQEPIPALLSSDPLDVPASGIASHSDADHQTIESGQARESIHSNETKTVMAQSGIASGSDGDTAIMVADSAAADSHVVQIPEVDDLGVKTTMLAEGGKLQEFPNLDKITSWPSGGQHIESFDGTNTYFFENGDWLWTHPDGTVVEGRSTLSGEKDPMKIIVAGLTDGFKFHVTTTNTEGAVIEGFPTDSTYIQEPPPRLGFGRYDKVEILDEGTVRRQTPLGDVISLKDGVETTNFRNGGTLTDYKNGALVFEDPSKAVFTQFSDGNWIWTHPDTTVVRGVPDPADIQPTDTKVGDLLDKEDSTTHIAIRQSDGSTRRFFVTTTTKGGETLEGYPQGDDYIKQPFSRTMVDSDRITKFPDGRKITEWYQGDQTTNYPDNIEVHESQGNRRTNYPDGTMLGERDGEAHYVFPNKNSFKLLADHTTVERIGYREIITQLDGTATEKLIPHWQPGGWWATPKDGGTLIAQNQYGDESVTDEHGTERITYKAGDVATRYKTGSEVLDSSDGSKFYRFTNGDWMWTHPDQTIVEGKLKTDLGGAPGYAAPADAEYDVTTTNPDESVKKGYSTGDGHISQPYSRLVDKDNNVTTLFPDGRIVTEGAGRLSTKETKYPDQTVVTETRPGHAEYQFASGMRYIEDRNFTSHIFGSYDHLLIKTDGTIIDARPDGYMSVEEDGQKTFTDEKGFEIVQDADGNLIGQSDPSVLDGK